MNVKRTPAEVTDKERQTAQVIDLLNRDPRYQDFKSPYISMVVHAEEALGRALLALAEFQEVQDALRLEVDSTGQTMRNVLGEHAQVRDRCEALIETMQVVVSAMARFQKDMSGDSGMLLKADITLNGVPVLDIDGADTGMRQGGIIGRAGNALLGDLGVVNTVKNQLTGKNGVAHRFEVTLNGEKGIAQKLEARLNGGKGVASTFDRRIGKTVGDAEHAVAQLVEQVAELVTLMRSATFFGIAAATILGIGMLLGVAITKLLH